MKTIEINGKHYEKVKGKDCQKCSFSRTMCFKIPETRNCIAENIIFVEVKK